MRKRLQNVSAKILDNLIFVKVVEKQELQIIVTKDKIKIR